MQIALNTGSFSPSCEITAMILSYSVVWNSASFTLSNTPRRCAWKTNASTIIFAILPKIKNPKEKKEREKNKQNPRNQISIHKPFS